jgi:OOP family OmpA-OmpF porin
MTQNNQIIGSSSRGLLGVAALVVSVAVYAQRPLVETSEGQHLYNSAGECWSSAGGVPGYCGPAPDNDGDGVAEDVDQCPDTPRGMAVDAAGCSDDADWDGVADANDQCPATKLGVRVNGRGCDLDLDGDGIPYYSDQCQTTPSGVAVNAAGCAAKMVLGDLLFEFDRAELTPRAKQLLSDLSRTLQDRPDISRIQVSGHADSTGSGAHNQTLSEARARTVKLYLHAVGVKQPMDVAGHGENQPLVSNDHKDGRARNRRVEIEFDTSAR